VSVCVNEDFSGGPAPTPLRIVAAQISAAGTIKRIGIHISYTGNHIILLDAKPPTRI